MVFVQKYDNMNLPFIAKVTFFGISKNKIRVLSKLDNEVFIQVYGFDKPSCFIDAKKALYTNTSI